MIAWVPKKTVDWPHVQSLLAECEQTGQYTNGGPVVKRLEHFLAHHLGIDASSKEVICVSNGAVAIWAAAAALELHTGRTLRWATQAFTFPPSAQGFLKDTLIVDIDDEGGLDLNAVPLDAVDGIIVTNVFGNTVNVERYVEWSKAHGKFLLFDNAATAFSKTREGKNVGNMGHAATISFHHTKPLGFGEGGAIIIDKDYAAAVRRIINFGIDNGAENPVWDRLGSNYKMSDIAAAYILQYLDRGQLESILHHHRHLYSYAVARLPAGIQPFPTYDSSPFVACLALLMEPGRSLRAQEALAKQGIFSRKYYRPLEPLPKTQALYDRILCIPLHRDLTERDMDRMLDILHAA